MIGQPARMIMRGPVMPRTSGSAALSVVAAGGLPAADFGVGYYRQGVGVGDTAASGLAQGGVERMPAVALQVQGQVGGGDQLVLKLPWLLADDLADEGIGGHPGGQELFLLDEGTGARRRPAPRPG